MLESFQKIKNLFQKETVVTPGLLSIYISENFISLTYTKNVTGRPAVSIVERVPLLNTNIEAVLVTFIKQHALPHVQCVLTLNPTDYRLIYLDAPNITDEELGGAAKWLVKDLIQFPLANAVVDAFRVPVRPGQASKMYAVVTKLDRMKQLLSVCEKADINVVSIDIAELSLRNLMHLLEEEKNEVGLLFMRPDFHVVIVSADHQLCFSRMIETKGQYQQHEVPHDEQQFMRLVTEIERTVNYYRSNIGNQTLKKIWVSTELSHQETLIDALSERMPIIYEALSFSHCFNAIDGVDLSTAVRHAISLGGLLRREF